ncbi:hypothetical protein M406DRAFT_327571 [Cryphonectria parasitica EP155]|uniref:Uncharacterized protein n=1 Tax=Cryphonectria parasitica (strain ATCC 38755 / EP155) TaxID=660469 RepID=A0A9P4Y9A3_CRYP1|nr:uncharacterized protein M406DRAFT_327571 [Cryphonectria parasitica EP155]KAF3769168.1 hypothetical protein M406DRAFT_327571 [Cryphonectria parasitica EP155]
MGLFLERITLSCINIFCITAIIRDARGGCRLPDRFLCGVIPGHVHGFYITWTYFSRKRKVKKGRYPGGPKAFIYSRKVINGDASDEKVRQLWRAEQRAKEDKLMRKRSSKRSSRSSPSSPMSSASHRWSGQSSGVVGSRRGPSTAASRRGGGGGSRRQSAVMN